MTDAIAVDLTALRPRWCDTKGALHDIFPSFCVGWIPGEPAIVGDLARVHRRARTPGAHGLESRLDLENRARYHWAEGWLRMMERPDSPEPAGVRMAWRPDGRQEVRIAFTDAIWELVSEFQRMTGARRLGLVVPGGLGTGAQEELITALERGDRFEEVQLFPRPIAAAISWARAHHGKGGKLLVTTAFADFWEADVVELRMAPDGVLCPVQDRTGRPSEFRCVGLEKAFAQQANRAEEWRRRLLEPAARDVVDRPSRAAQVVSLTDIPESCAAAMEEARNLQQHGSLRGHVHVGLLQAGCVPAVFNCPRAMPLPELDVNDSAVLAGVMCGMERLAAGAVPYFEALAPVYLKVDRRNKYLDPVTEWRLLTDEEHQVVPAGAEYVSAAPLTGFALPAGQRKLPMFLRVHRREKPEFRLMDSDLEVQKQSTPVQISLRMRPGRGQARVAIESVVDGVFGIELRERELTPVKGEDANLRAYSWPVGSAVIVQRPDADDVTSALRRIVREAEVARFVSPANVEELTRLFAQHQDPAQVGFTKEALQVPEDVYFGFVRVGRIASGRDWAIRPEHEELLARLSPPLVSTVNDYAEGGDGEVVAAVTLAGWLYSRCPEPILDVVRQRIQEQTQPLAYVNCAGRAFEALSDMRLFFRLFCERIEDGEDKLQWWRAARNLMQMRVDALSFDALSERQMQSVLKGLVDMMAYRMADNPHSPFVGEGLRIACHILKRRRFEPEFLSENSTMLERWRSVLVSASKRARISWRGLARAARDLLARKGEPGTLEEIRKDLAGQAD